MKQILTFCSIFFSGFIFAQIKSETKVVKKIAPEFTSSTSYYLGAGRNNSFRVLQENDAPYGRPLNKRADETNLKVWSYELGLRRQIKPFLQFDGGVSIERFGEQYSATGPTQGGDSTFSYNTIYTYTSIPIQLYATVGKEFKIYGGAGLSPGLISAFKRETTVTDSLGSTNTTTVNNPERMNSMLLQARLTGGLQWDWNERAGIYVCYTYLLGLNSTYGKQDQYKHYARYGGIRFGITIRFPEEK